MKYYKDSYGINQRSAIPEKLKELVSIVCDNDYDEVLLPHPRKRYCHQYEHVQCALDLRKTKRATEKRICHCWNYYNKNCHADKCANCEFEFKKTNAGEIKICDFEVPTDFSMENLGGIDWLLDDNGKTLATEVKPPESDETIVRLQQMDALIGYKMWLRSAEWDCSLHAGIRSKVKLVIRNDGAAPLHALWPIALAIFDEDEMICMQQTGLNTSMILPGDNELTAWIDLPNMAEVGAYTLKLAILDPATGQPGLQLSNVGFDVQTLWMELGEIRVIGGWNDFGGRAG